MAESRIQNEKIENDDNVIKVSRKTADREFRMGLLGIRRDARESANKYGKPSKNIMHEPMTE